MLLKIIGSGILLLAGGYVSMAIVAFERRRLRVLDGYISLIYYIKGQIDCYALPLTDILANTDPAILAACLGVDAGELSLSAEPPGTYDLPGMLQRSRLYLHSESERLLDTMTGELGTTYRAEQVRRCEYYLTALTEERRRLYDALPGRLRTTCTLCLCCAVGMAVLLW